MNLLQPWQTIDKQVVFRNRWAGVEIDQVVLPDGAQYEYTRLLPAGVGVGVIGFNDDGQALLEREYRHGVGDVIWQLPGGLCDDGEELIQAGLRELLEETGYQPRNNDNDTVRYLGSVWDNPAMGSGVSHIVAVWGLEPIAEPTWDAHEFVTLHWQSTDWLREAVRSGEIRDRVVIAALTHLMIEGLV